MSDRLRRHAGQAPRGRTSPTRRQADLTARSRPTPVGARHGGGSPCPSIALALLMLINRFDPAFYAKWIIPEGYGVLEFSQFATMLIALALAIRLLFKPFVRRRPFVLTVTIIAALSCLYIAGEEMSWGQHFFHWNTPEYWAEVNRQQETNLHNTYAVFEKYPRAVLELGVLIGGIIIPIAAMFDPGCAPTGYRCSCRRSRCCRWRSRPWASSSPTWAFRRATWES